MKKLLLILLVLLLNFINFSIFASEPELRQWEYMTLDMPHAAIPTMQRSKVDGYVARTLLYGTVINGDSVLEETLDMLGADGWELAAISGNIAILKRPLSYEYQALTELNRLRAEYCNPKELTSVQDSKYIYMESDKERLNEIDEFLYSRKISELNLERGTITAMNNRSNIQLYYTLPDSVMQDGLYDENAIIAELGKIKPLLKDFPVGDDTFINGVIIASVDTYRGSFNVGFLSFVYNDNAWNINIGV